MSHIFNFADFAEFAHFAHFVNFAHFVDFSPPLLYHAILDKIAVCALWILLHRLELLVNVLSAVWML